MNDELILPSKGIKKEFQETLARTNFWLAEMRKVLDIRVEVKVNWHPMGFNGCGLISYSNEPLGFCFYSEPLNSADNFEISGVSIYFLSSKFVDSDTVKKELLKANEEFDKFLKAKGADVLFQVSRFSLVASFWGHGEEITQEKNYNPILSQTVRAKFPIVEDLVNKISESFQNSEVRWYIQFLNLISYEIEFIFESPISEVEFIEKLKAFFPNFKMVFWDGIYIQTIRLPI